MKFRDFKRCKKCVVSYYLPVVKTDFLLARISLLVCRSPTRISKRDFAAVVTQFVYVTENRIKNILKMGLGPGSFWWEHFLSFILFLKNFISLKLVFKKDFFDVNFKIFIQTFISYLKPFFWYLSNNMVLSAKCQNISKKDGPGFEPTPRPLIN